jgi:hypothetical protein
MFVFSKWSRALAEPVAALERSLADQHPEVNQQMTALLEDPETDRELKEDHLHEVIGYKEGTATTEDCGAGTKSHRLSGSPRSGLVSELARAEL